MDRRIGIALLVLALVAPAGAATIVEMRHLPARPYTVVPGDSVKALAWRILGHARADQSMQRILTHSGIAFAPGATFRVRPIHIAVRVEEGDNWASLAAQFRGLTGPGAPSWLAAWNGTTPTALTIGTVVQIPPAIGAELAATPADQTSTLTPVTLGADGQLRQLAERRAAHQPKVAEPVYAFTWMSDPVAAPPLPAPVGKPSRVPGAPTPAPRAPAPAATAAVGAVVVQEPAKPAALESMVGLVASPLVAAEALAGQAALALVRPVRSLPGCDDVICLRPPQDLEVPCSDPFETVRYDVIPAAPAAPAAAPVLATSLPQGDWWIEHNEPPRLLAQKPAVEAPKTAPPPLSAPVGKPSRVPAVVAEMPKLVPLLRPLTCDAVSAKKSAPPATTAPAAQTATLQLEPLIQLAPASSPYRAVASRPAPRAVKLSNLDEMLYGAPAVVPAEPPAPRTGSPVLAAQLAAARQRVRGLRARLASALIQVAVAPAPPAKPAVVIPPAPRVAVPVVITPTPALAPAAAAAPPPLPAPTGKPSRAPTTIAESTPATRRQHTMMGRFRHAMCSMLGRSRTPNAERADVTQLAAQLPSSRGIPSSGVLSELAPIREIPPSAPAVDPPAKMAEMSSDFSYNQWCPPPLGGRI